MSERETTEQERMAEVLREQFERPSLEPGSGFRISLDDAERWKGRADRYRRREEALRLALRRIAHDMHTAAECRVIALTALGEEEPDAQHT